MGDYSSESARTCNKLRAVNLNPYVSLQMFMDLQAYVDGIVRFSKLVGLAVVTFIIVVFVPLASRKFHYPGGLVSGLLILAIAAYIYSRRDRLRLSLRHDTGRFRFVAKNLWRTKVLEEGSICDTPSVSIEKFTESTATKSGRVAQDWYTLVVRESSSDPGKKTIAFGNLQLAEDAKSKIEDFFRTKGSEPLDISGKEPMIAAIAYAILGLCLCLFGPR